MSSLSRDPQSRPDPILGANWNDGHVPAPAGHAPRLEIHTYPEYGILELREPESGACITAEKVIDAEAWR